ncbi:MAG TPA: hypothetical protein PLI00_13235 [Pseudomonadota bacterium]|nr:hypothetical protein [Thermomonas sp.]HQY37541.1 hypothetical protein [Pseudomonadota bacterium]
MSFIAELNRRNVVRTGLLYLVASWLLLQVADVLFGALELPPWSVRLVLGILILGFPLTLIFSWVYELTPEGLKREHEVERNASITAATARKLNVLIVVLLLAATGLLVANRFLPGAAPADVAATAAPGAIPATDAGAKAGEPSIAVLPFVNMSGDPENEYFSDGLSEELLNVLARMPGLRVIARTSSFAFKGEKTDIATVAAKLAVAHVLEGSVRKAGGRVRITAQLIRAADSSHLWSDTYDRDVADIFAVQDEIAREVAGELKLRLLPAQIAGAELGGTRNVEAHDLYLRAAAIIPTVGMREGLDQRLAYADQALALDPDFAKAHVARAEVLRILTTNGWMPPAQGYAAARAALARALELAPDLAEAYTERSRINLVTLDWAAAAADSARAMALNPGNVIVQIDHANHRFAMGHRDEAIAAARVAVSLDPVGIRSRSFLGMLLRYDRQYAESERILSALIAEAPKLGNVHYELGQIALSTGDPERARAEFEAETVDWKHATGLAMAWHALGQPDKARQALDALLATGDPDWSAFQQAQIHAQWGEPDAAFAALETALRVGDPALVAILSDPFLDPLRPDPRFAQLLARLKLPA